MTKARAGGLSRLRIILWGVVILVGILATIFYMVAPPKQTIGFGSPFSLQATTGETFTQDSLKGTPTLMFFGYTFCPDVCPTTLVESTGWRSSLGLDENSLRIVFVSVDPERDTLDSMREYLSAFGSPVIGLTGTQEEIDNAKRVFSVFSEKVNDPGASEYLINHTASVFMINDQGEFIGTISFGEDRDVALEKIKRLVGI